MKSKVTRRPILRWLLLVFCFSFFIAPATFELLSQKWVISHDLAHAKTIRLEHYRDYDDISEKDNRVTKREEVFASKDLSLEDIHKVEKAFPVFFDIGFPGLQTGCIFNPHHRIIITDSSGKVTVIRVCFECDHVSIGDADEYSGEIRATPFVWMATLRRFFADEGMPNSPEFYRPGWTSNPEPAANAAPTGAR